MLAILEDLHAVHKHVMYADGVLVRVLECRSVSDCCRIENHDISKHPYFEKSATIKTEVRRWQTRETAYRLC
jgi:hypothetical protein